jgi:NAD(P)-dependent dehydrogenase (short-subunit alcohol dehydrogenase family)
LQVERVFQQILDEEGRLDILVNNAFSAINVLFEHFGEPFWNIPESIWDDINAVGLR